MKARSFGFVAAATHARTAREPDLGTSEGLIEHSLHRGELATLTAVAERGVQRGARPQAVQVVDVDGTRVVARVADVEREQRDAEWNHRRVLEANRRALEHHRQKDADHGE